MEIQAGARCQLIRLWRRISPLLMFDVSPADSQAPLPRITHHPHPHTPTTPASEKGCQQIWRISRVCTSGIWRDEEQVRSRESNGPSLEPRGFGKPSPTYPAPSAQLQYILLLSLQSASHIQFSKLAPERLLSFWSMSLSDLRGLVVITFWERASG